jgi:hypothetical protein
VVVMHALILEIADPCSRLDECLEGSDIPKTCGLTYS